MRLHSRQNLPPIENCDFDLGPGTGFGPDFAGEIPWLVGGNDADQLPTVPEDGFFDFGINAVAPVDPLAEPELAALANAGIDIITAGEERIRIFGTATDDPEYQEAMEGRVVIANGFIETEDVPAELVVIPAPATGPIPTGVPGGAIANLYLERPSNVYNVFIGDEEAAALVFIPPEFPIDELAAALVEFGGAPDTAPFTVEAFDELVALAEGGDADAEAALLEIVTIASADAGITPVTFPAFVRLILPFLAAGIVPGTAGVRVLVLANIFLGDAPEPGVAVLGPTFDPDAATGGVQPNAAGFGSQLYEELGIDSFEYLLKVINGGATDVALFFGVPDDIEIGGLGADALEADDSDIYSNANVGGAGFFLIPAGGAGFFEMRVDDGIAHIMLSNVQYSNYVEPEPELDA